MSEKIAIITGAGSGIGRATALELSRLGYALALAGRRKQQLEETARLCTTSTVVIPTDITNPTDCDSLIAKTLERFARIDVLVNNAGYAPILPIEELTNDEWRRILDTNLSGPLYLMRAAWPTFRRQQSGVIVNISSEAARDPFPGLGAYGAAKVALNLLGKSLAREGAADNILVHTIAPAAVETEMLRAIVPIDQYPTEKTLGPQEVARVIAQCIAGDLQHTSGETIYLHKTV